MIKSRIRNYKPIVFLILIGFGFIDEAIAQHPVPKELVSPIPGKLMMVGTGEISARVGATFAFLAGEKEGKLIIIRKARERDFGVRPQWQDLLGRISVIQLDQSVKTLPEADLSALRTSTAVWLSDDFSDYSVATQLQTELTSLLRRDGAVGGQGRAAESMAMLLKSGDGFRNGFNLLPNAIVMASKDGADQFAEMLNRLPGRVGWEIPPRAAVVISDGRKISVLDYPGITIRTAANGDWPERVAHFGPPVDELPYTTDLISWNRSATARLGEIFPPIAAPVPEVPTGALLIIGGHGDPEGMWEKVMDIAGGKEAYYVCLSQTESCAAAEKLRSLGCRNIAIHMVSNGVDGIGQGEDATLLQDLQKANAVYFGGGRTYRFMDAYLDTPAQKLMNAVLERGGIIIGSSAGAQIQGDFLVRGDPRSNDTLWMEGNDRGLGFIRGVIIDAHFRERGRENILPSLLIKHPRMLGIGIDETTAIFVQGTTAEVMGPHTVSFYNLEKDNKAAHSLIEVSKSLVLMAGQKYDFKLRKQID